MVGTGDQRLHLQYAHTKCNILFTLRKLLPQYRDFLWLENAPADFVPNFPEGTPSSCEGCLVWFDTISDLLQEIAACRSFIYDILGDWFSEWHFNLTDYLRKRKQGIGERT